MMMVTREWSDWRNGWMWWLQSVYVLPSRRGSGVFRNLLDHVTSIAQSEKNIVGLRLYVEQENQAAQETYRRTGFADSRYIVMNRSLG